MHKEMFETKLLCVDVDPLELLFCNCPIHYLFPLGQDRMKLRHETDREPPPKFHKKSG